MVNDQENSDGSFIVPVTAGSLEGKMRQALTATNFSPLARTLDSHFVADRIQTEDNTAALSMTLEAGQREIVRTSSKSCVAR